jgi:hypothetical protein
MTRIKQFVKLRTVLLRYPCEGYFSHLHKTKIISILCHVIQNKLPMQRLHFTWLYFFNPKQLYKLEMSLKHGKRALKRRIERGEKAV